jgi:hypothetical protein
MTKEEMINQLVMMVKMMNPHAEEKAFAEYRERLNQMSYSEIQNIFIMNTL